MMTFKDSSLIIVNDRIKQYVFGHRKDHFIEKSVLYEKWTMSGNSIERRKTECKFEFFCEKFG